MRPCLALILAFVLACDNSSGPGITLDVTPDSVQLVRNDSLAGGPFGSAVSSPGVGWVGQPSAGQVSRLNIGAGTITGAIHPGP